jgi:hypothetical protein
MTDLLAFTTTDLYFEGVAPEVEALIAAAASHYGEPQALELLQQALRLAPDHLMVRVALYRYHFYQHHHREALAIARDSLLLAARQLGISHEWRELTPAVVAAIPDRQIGLLRLYLSILKAMAWLHLALGEGESGRVLLKAVVAVDPHDRLGCAALLAICNEANQHLPAEQTGVSES